ncbi:molybdenum cofactor guanylyltransferase MobA [Methylobacillus flagellatus]|uniref:Molybdenum cofactor guanylyltransferase n=1 Tax=Methylobacillus flagellatus (strain ATCC 51484 / DSM 6875 / VKM B-1610 / KT) TaxID=265072 RepID=Q1GYX5_METFK|nr:molybdenum cofactor guanylyltransferase MobA [Methylobacillus flagellatus]ABE50562.1 molybdenum cofactor guanylyltransferase [Methylobacillus flagellatus KT]
MSITGIVLAGGKGTRMGGANKGLLEFHGRPMVAHVLHRLAPQVDELMINANREIERYRQMGYPVIQDEISGFAGPLAGLHAGMQHAQHPYILTVPCDSPLLPSNLAKRLINALIERDADIAIAKTGTQAHPVFSLCRKALLPKLELFLERGERKMTEWIAELDSIEVSFTDQAPAFTNINTPEELRILEQAA